MIPQGFPLEIVGSDGKAYLVVGWRDYTGTFRPVVVPVSAGRTTMHAYPLPGDIVWRART